MKSFTHPYRTRVQIHVTSKMSAVLSIIFLRCPCLAVVLCWVGPFTLTASCQAISSLRLSLHVLSFKQTNCNQGFVYHLMTFKSVYSIHVCTTVYPSAHKTSHVQTVQDQNPFFLPLESVLEDCTIIHCFIQFGSGSHIICFSLFFILLQAKMVSKL